MLMACSNGYLEVTQWLYGAGAAEDVRTADEDGRTPVRTFDTAQLFILNTVQNTSSEAKMCI